MPHVSIPLLPGYRVTVLPHPLGRLWPRLSRLLFESTALGLAAYFIDQYRKAAEHAHYPGIISMLLVIFISSTMWDMTAIGTDLDWRGGDAPLWAMLIDIIFFFLIFITGFYVPASVDLSGIGYTNHVLWKTLHSLSLMIGPWFLITMVWGAFIGKNHVLR